MSDPKLLEAVKLLTSGYYVIFIDGLPVITSKLIRELEQITPEQLTQSINRNLVVLDDKTKQIVLSPDVKRPFVEFIMACNIPRRINLRGGGSFWANKYSKEADKEFQKILKEGYRLDILMAATKLYYKSDSCCEAISNFITRGTWVIHYEELKQSLENDTVNEHITKTISQQTEGRPDYQTR